MSGDEIHILGLEMPVRIGVPEAERAAWQTVTADIIVTLSRAFDMMHDELSDTLDYERAANEAAALAASRPRQLLETLAADLVGHFLQDERVRAGSQRRNASPKVTSTGADRRLTPL